MPENSLPATFVARLVGHADAWAKYFVLHWFLLARWEDIAQETLALVLQKLPTNYEHLIDPQNDSDCRKLVGAFAKNVARTEARKAKRWVLVGDETALDVVMTQRDGGGYQPSVNTNSDLTEQVLARLPEQERTVFSLTAQGWSASLIAAELSARGFAATKGSVDKCLSRIKADMAALTFEQIVHSPATTNEQQRDAEDVLNMYAALKEQATTEAKCEAAERAQASGTGTPEKKPRAKLVTFEDAQEAVANAKGIDPKKFQEKMAAARRAAFRPTQAAPPNNDDDGPPPFVVES